MIFSISFFSSTNSTLLTKTITDKGDFLEKDASTSRMSLGECVVFRITPEELYEKLRSLNSDRAPKNIALGLGVPSLDNVTIVSRYLSARIPEGITRTKDNFGYPEGAGVCLLDYDPRQGQAVLTEEEYVNILKEVEPALANCAMVISYSTSSGIYHRQPGPSDYELVEIDNPAYGYVDLGAYSENETIIARVQKPVSGAGGLHLYLPISDGRQIERILDVIYKRLWIKGYGYIKVSASGQLLERTLVDAAVGSPERLIFESRPAIARSLVQLRRDPVYIQGDILDVEQVSNLSSEEEALYTSMVAAAKAALRPAAEAKARAFTETKTRELISKGVHPSLAKKHLENAKSDQPVLVGIWPLHFQDYGSVRVADVLLDRNKYHEADLLDPFEGQDSQRWRARLYANPNGTVLINSFDGGGVVYRLERQVIEILPSQSYTIMEKLQAILMEPSEPCIYQRGGELVLLIRDDIGRARIESFDKHKLRVLISKLAVALKRKEDEWYASDLDDKHLDTLLKLGDWRFPRLVGVVNHPILSKQGDILQNEGYHRETGIYLDFVGAVFEPIPEKPSKDDAVSAVAYLRQTYSSFDFKSDVDFAVHLATLLTGILRRTLHTAPMFHYGAPVPGTGKTLLASSVAIVLTGEEPRTMNYTKDEDESRKRYLAFLREGHAVGLIDNVSTALTGDTLCTILTESVFTDRVLGVSQNLTVPTNTLLISTGNNTAICGDLIRRVLVCQLDPLCERPHERDFSEDFREVSRSKRAPIQAAALTILRAYEVAGRPSVGVTALGSFEEWSRRVRQALIWSGVTDPVLSLAQNMGDDETLTQLGELLEAWLYCYKSIGVTAKEVIRDCSKLHLDEGTERLSDAIEEVVMTNGTKMDARVLGSYLRQHIGRLVNHLKFEVCGEKQRAKKWHVVSA